MGNDGGAIGKNSGGGATGNKHRALAQAPPGSGREGDANVAKQLNTGTNTANVTKQDRQDWIDSNGVYGARNTGGVRSKAANQVQAQVTQNLTAAQKRATGVRHKNDRRPEDPRLTGKRVMRATRAQLATHKRLMTQSFKSTTGSGNTRPVGKMVVRDLGTRANGTRRGYEITQRYTNSMSNQKYHGVSANKPGALGTARGQVRRLSSTRPSGPTPRVTTRTPGVKINTIKPQRTGRSVPLDEQKAATKRTRSAQR